MTEYLDEYKPFLGQIAALDLELDQRLAWAVQHSAINDRGKHLVMDNLVFRRLMETVPEFARLLPGCDVLSLWASDGGFHHNYVSSVGAHLDHQFWRIMNRIIIGLKGRKTITSSDFIKATAAQSIESRGCARPLSSDAIMGMFTPKGATGGIVSISEVPAAENLLRIFLASEYTPDDFEFIITEDHGRLRPAVVSVIADYVESSDSGILTQRRMLHLSGKCDFTAFTADEIAELEDLINDPLTRELQLQTFFERHPHFFRRWDIREVYPQVCLQRGKNPLEPDFILTDNETQRAFVLELKLPRPKLVVGTDNRRRFAAAVKEAEAQLLRYRDWFREEANRDHFYRETKSLVYEPQMCVVIGRQSSFKTPFERHMLRAKNPDIEVVTYDEMLTFAKRRLRT